MEPFLTVKMQSVALGWRGLGGSRMSEQNQELTPFRTSLQYDLNGNLTNDGNGLVYEYDAADRTTAIVRNTTNRTEFAYDGWGRRVQVIEKQNGTALSTNKYVWSSTELCEERNNSGATVTKRFFGQGEQISGVNFFFTSDHLGSVREMTDANGAVRARYDYDPYGRRTKVVGDLAADFGYTGHFMLTTQPDHTITFYRLYRPDLGRWCSRDPLAERAGLNLYAYVLNDPLNKVDPKGDIIWYVIGGAALVIVFGTAAYLWNSTKSKADAHNAKVAKEIQKGDHSGQGTVGQGEPIQDYMKDVAETAAAATEGTSAGGGPVGITEDAVDGAVKIVGDAISNPEEISDKSQSAWDWIQEKLHKKKQFGIWRKCSNNSLEIKTSETSPGPGWEQIGTITK